MLLKHVLFSFAGTNTDEFLMLQQNKKRKYNKDRDDEREDRERTPEEQEDPLKDATTLYVGNLWVSTKASVRLSWRGSYVADPSTQQKSRFMSSLQSKVSIGDNSLFDR